MRRYLLLFVTFILGLAAMPAAGVAQETTATVIGTVTDESGGVVPGVTVTLPHLGTNQTFERVTTSEGSYMAPLLPIGEYEITFITSSYAAEWPRSGGGVVNVVTISEQQQRHPRGVRHLLRPAARRHLRAELLHHAAARQQRGVEQPATE